jgi:hypothetical protein
LFNSDDAHEYLISAFREGDEVLLVCNTKGEILYEFANDVNMGGKIAANYLLTNANKSTLVLVYSDNNQKYTLNYYDLLFEDDEENTETALDVVESAVVFDGEVLMAEGDIYLFNVNGQLIMQGADRMDVTELSAGVYVVKTASTTAKIVIK